MARIRGCVVLLAIAGLWGVGHGVPPEEREERAVQAVANVEGWIRAHPKDGAGYHALGRIHALAWANSDVIPLAGSVPGELPTFSNRSILVRRTGPEEWYAGDGSRALSAYWEERPVNGVDAKHLGASIAAYRQAIALDAKDAMSELGLAWMIAQQGVYARDLPADYWGEVKPTDKERAAWNEAVGQLGREDPKVRDAASQALLAAMPRCVVLLREVKADDPETRARIEAVARDYFALQALEHYGKAYDLRAQADLKEEPTFLADSQISAEAGAEMLAVLVKHPEAAKEGEVKAMRGVLDALARKMEKLRSAPRAVF
jgi:hypothetical protein